MVNEPNGQPRRRSSRTSKKAGAKQASYARTRLSTRLCQLGANDQAGGASPTSLLSLPTEIITQIISLLDGTSAFRLALTTRRLTPIATAKLFRDLDLTVTHSTLRRHIPIRPPFSHGPEAEAEVVRTPIPHLNRIGQTRLQAVLLAGGREKWGTVEKLRCMARPGSTHGLLQLLEFVAPNLRQLWLDSGHPGGESGDSRVTFDALSIECELHFPTLTHVRLGKRTIQSAGFLLYLCDAAPQLTSLDVNLYNVPEPEWMADLVYPRLSRDTLITQLRIAFGDEHGELLDDYDCDNEDIIAHPILSLIRHSPLTRQFSVEFIDGGGYGATMFDYILVAMKEWKDLQDVQWLSYNRSLYPGALGTCPDDAQDFSSLRSCILDPIDLIEFFEHMPAGPFLEIMHFVGPLQLTPNPSRNLPSIPPHRLAKLSQAQHLTPSFADNIISSPHLRHINIGPDIDIEGGFEMFNKLKDIQKSGESTGFVDSYIHGEEELLRVRLLLDLVEIQDRGYEDDRTARTGTSMTFTYEVVDEDGPEDRYRTFEPLPAAVW